MATISERRDSKSVIEAITTVQAYLDAEWIDEGCRNHQSFGCASCRAVALRRELSLLADDLIGAESE